MCVLSCFPLILSGDLIFAQPIPIYFEQIQLFANILLQVFVKFTTNSCVHSYYDEFDDTLLILFSLRQANRAHFNQ